MSARRLHEYPPRSYLPSCAQTGSAHVRFVNARLCIRLSAHGSKHMFASASTYMIMSVRMFACANVRMSKYAVGKRFLQGGDEMHVYIRMRTHMPLGMPMTMPTSGAAALTGCIGMRILTTVSTCVHVHGHGRERTYMHTPGLE
jgi:hypothetical protein